MMRKEFLSFMNEDGFFNEYISNYIEGHYMNDSTGNALLAMMNMNIPYFHIYEVKGIDTERRNTVIEITVEYYSNTFNVEICFDEREEVYIIK